MRTRPVGQTMSHRFGLMDYTGQGDEPCPSQLYAYLSNYASI